MRYAVANRIIVAGLLLCLLLALGACQVGPPTAEQRAATATAVLPTEGPKLTSDEIKAIRAIGLQLGVLGDALTQISTLTKHPEPTDSWKYDLFVQMVRIHQAHQALLDLDVPPKLGALRAAVLSATSDCNASVDKLASGIDMNRESDIESAGILMRSCGSKASKAQLELDRLLSQ